MTDEELQAARALVDRATPGPWRQDGDDRVCNGRCGEPFEYREGSRDSLIERHGHCLTVARTEDSPDDDAAFIAASRTLVPQLLAEIDRLRVERDAASEARIRLAINHCIDCEGPLIHCQCSPDCFGAACPRCMPNAARSLVTGEDGDR